MLILFIFLALLIALGILFLSGKCGFLISGFNAIHGGKENLKENLDEKKPVLLCPHGRPIYTTISRTQIEKWFKRIV